MYCSLNYNRERLIEETNGDYETERSGPIELFVEFLLVTDITVFNHHKDLLGVDDPQKVLTHMRTYFSHIINGVTITPYEFNYSTLTTSSGFSFKR